ncbi:MAG: Asp23/Gls24 family envelope stress response protein, partial [Candidatus Bipolaricaulia bacterium]
MEDILQAGKMEIAEEVIRSIAAIAAAEVEGLGGMEGSVADQVVGIFGGRQKGVETEVSDGSVKISLKIAVQYGYPLHELGQRVQKQV